MAILALVLGTVANLVPSRHIAWWGKGLEPPRSGVDYTVLDPVSADALRTSLPAVVLLDTRSPEEYRAARIPGARPISFARVNLELNASMMEELRRSDAVVLYGSSTETDIEQLLAQQLKQKGLAKPYVLMGGFPGWQAAGLPEESDAR